jgi:hypothetical protein
VTTNIQLLRSSVAQKRPNPASLLDGQPAININVDEPGLFFKATDGTLFKVGPAAITSSGSPPNASAVGPVGNVKGELWLDGRSAYSNAVLKIYNGTQWVPTSGFQVNDTNGGFTLSRALTVSTLIANGSGASSFIRVPQGPNADESLISAVAGMIRFDTTLDVFRGYNGTNWSDLGTGNIAGNLTVGGNGTIAGNLTIDGSTTIGNDCTSDLLTVNSTANFNCNVTVGNEASDRLTVASLSDFQNAVRLSNQNDLRFHSGSVGASNYVGFQAPGSIPSNVLWTLPQQDGTLGQALITNGTGVLSWGAAGGGGSQVTVGDSAPTSPSPNNGDLWYNSATGRLYVYYQDGTTNQWVDAAPNSSGVAAIRILDSIASQFDGVNDTFALTVGGFAFTPVNPQQLIVHVNGVYQNPATAYTVVGSNIIFAAGNIPGFGQSFSGAVLGAAITQNTVADLSISTLKLANLAVTDAKIANNTITGAKLAPGSIDVSKINIDGSLLPNTDNAFNLGSPTFRWANRYTGDLHLQNERGSWTVVEEEEYLSLRNNKTGKTFKIVMEAVD